MSLHNLCSATTVPIPGYTMHSFSSTHPKVCSSVDLEGEVNLVIREVQELCATDNPSIVHKDCHISHILLHLEGIQN